MSLTWGPGLEVLGHAQAFLSQLVPKLLQQPLNLSLKGSPSSHPNRLIFLRQPCLCPAGPFAQEPSVGHEYL